MTRMFGPMQGDDLMKLARQLETEIAGNPVAAQGQVIIPKGTLVALVNDLRDGINRRFFYELGRSLQLEENREAAKEKVPAKYHGDFELGVQDRKQLNFSEEHCNDCTFKSTALRTMRGRVHFVRHINKEESTVG